MFFSPFASMPLSALLLIASIILVVYFIAKNILNKQAEQFMQLRQEIQQLKIELLAYLSQQERTVIHEESHTSQDEEALQEISEDTSVDLLSPNTYQPSISTDTSELEIQAQSPIAYANAEIEPSSIDTYKEKIEHFETTARIEDPAINEKDAELDKTASVETSTYEQISINNESDIEPIETKDSMHIETKSLYSNSTEAFLEQEPTWVEKQIERVKNWFFAGNWPVNIGILIFLIGIGALLRYLIQTGIIDVSISAKLAAVGAVGLAGLFMGWKTRLSKPVFGLALQGGSVGILLLVVFAASRLYEVIPISLAFGITVFILAASILMSLKQNSLVLVAFAICAAYTAPLWLSTGSNNFIGLFSYYALINIVVVIMALFRSWPLLNTIGYVFNATVGSLWAHYNYVTENFVIIQFFIALFFLFFTIIPIIYSRRMPLDVLFKNRKVNWVAIHSYLLMLITPGIVVIWEHRLFQTGVPWDNIDRSYLLASVIWGIAVVQLGLGFLQIKQPLHKEQGRIYYWLALGLATIAVPIAFSTDITGILFIAEGVMLYYIAAKSLPSIVRNTLIILGLGLHGLAILLILESLGLTIYATFTLETVQINDYLLTFSLASGMAISLHALSKQVAIIKQQVAASPSIRIQMHVYKWLAFILGLCSITAFIQYKLPEVHAFELLAFVFTTLTIILYNLASRYWPKLSHLDELSSFTFIVLLGYVCTGLLMQFNALNYDIDNQLPSKLALLNFILLPMGLGHLLFKSSKKSIIGEVEKRKWINIGLKTNQTLFTIIASFVFYRASLLVIGAFSITYQEWLDALVLLPLAAIGYYVIKLNQSERLKAFLPPKFLYASLLAVWAGVAIIMVIPTLLEEGMSTPLFWIPIVNPTELPQLAIGICLLMVLKHFMYHLLYPRGLTPELQHSLKVVLYWITGASAFLFVQIVLIRMVYHWMLQDDIYWTLYELFSRSQIQATLTLYWSALAIIFWMYGTNKSNKSIWIIGAVLFGMALCKLLFIDRQHLGALSGIISFIVYGLFCVIIGYCLPPPKSNKTAETHLDD